MKRARMLVSQLKTNRPNDIVVHTAKLRPCLFYQALICFLRQGGCSPVLLVNPRLLIFYSEREAGIDTYYFLPK